jgi:tetratricopeptide (TPR) repeat protein
MKRKILYSTIIFSAIAFYSCAPSSQGTKPQTKGAVVYVYKPPTGGKMTLACRGSDKRPTITALYIGEYCDAQKKVPCITGKVDETDKGIIIQSARAYIANTNFIVPLKEAGDITPYMKIKVFKFSVNTVKDKDRIAKKGVFETSVNINYPTLKKDGSVDIVTCSSTQPILEEITYQEPIYKKHLLPSNEKIKNELVLETMDEVLNDFIPKKVKILRPVLAKSKYSEKLASMIDAGNYEGAIKIGKKYLTKYKEAQKDYAVYYDIGVAYEGKAWKYTSSMEEQLKNLKNAVEYYEKAIEINPKDETVNRAYGEVTEEVKILEDALKNQKLYQKQTTKELTTEF